MVDDSEKARSSSDASYSNDHYMLYADGDIIADLFAFEKMKNHWDYNDLVT